MTYRTPVEIADAIVGFLEAAEWTPDGGDAEAAFDTVERYHVNDMAKATQSLILHKARLAVVVPAGSRWETSERENEMSPVCRRVVSVTVLVSDRRIGNDDASVFGSATNPGSLDLAEIAIEGCTGSLFAAGTTVLCYPVNDGQIPMEDAKDPGRNIVAIDFECVTQWQSVL